MRLAYLAAAALILGSCGKKSLTLPADPIDQAASCGVIAAIEARAATTDIRAPLPFDAQGHILHYALLGGIEGGHFAAERAAAINQRMSVLQEKIIAGKWQDLAPQCRTAFPAANGQDVRMPTDPLDAKLGCDELGGFIGKALKNQLADYAIALGEYRDLDHKLDQSSMPAGLHARAGNDLEAQHKARSEAFAKIIPAGSPMAVMRECIKRYG